MSKHSKKSKGIIDLAREELNKIDQFFRVSPDIDDFIRSQLDGKTKQSYFSNIFLNLKNYGYVTKEPLTIELIQSIRKNLDYRETQIREEEDA